MPLDIPTSPWEQLAAGAATSALALSLHQHVVGKQLLEGPCSWFHGLLQQS